MTRIPNVTISLTCPDGLRLEQVQILVRHGERSPIWPRFQNTGLSPYWPYCSAAGRFNQVVLASQDGSRWENMTWRRSLETSGPDRRSKPAQGAGGKTSGICMPGELTDKGRESSLAFGKWLRWQYIDQLNLLPKQLSDASMLYVRTTEVPRVVESTQQILQGLYPLELNKTSAPWEIAMRSRAEETLIPNTKSCPRLAELVRAFSQEAAKTWNGSDDNEYLSEKLGKWIPGNKTLALGSRPSLLSTMDSINATHAHGPDTRLPDEFYDERVRKTIERIVIDEAFRGYTVSRELRMLGAGQLVGEIALKMIGQVEWNRGHTAQPSSPPKLSIFGCHDLTIGVVLASLGCLESKERWPPFTSHISFELFRQRQMHHQDSSASIKENGGELREIGGHPVEDFTTDEVRELSKYFVRIRYNDRVLRIPGCEAEGNRFENDANLCTLQAFKSIVDKFTPKNWRRACNSNLGNTSTTATDEQAGY
ncbi:histidine phosphatase superfamily [Astrocystis sublimbata]|nr:histidine phosphatase superfamily [Astrocystis sublimbata]